MAPGQGWWGHLQTEDELAKIRAHTAAEAAALLGVPVGEIELEETRRTQGIEIRARWIPTPCPVPPGP